MHIALVMNSAYGVRTLRSDLLRYLVGLNQRVTVICPLDDRIGEPESAGVRFANWRVTSSGANPLYESLAVLRLARILCRLQADVLLSFTPKAVVYASLAARISRTKNVFGVFAGLGFLFNNDRTQFRLGTHLIQTALRFVLRNNRIVFFQKSGRPAAFYTRERSPT